MTNSIAVTPETLPAIMWQNQPVITTELLADIYGTATDNIKVNFNNNKARFVENVHYYLLKGADLKAFKSQVNKIYPALIHKFTTSFYLWTERGTVRHAKILDTDNAWAVQEKLEDFYFSKKQPIQYGLKDHINEPEPLRICYATKEQREPLVKAVRKFVIVAQSKGRNISFEEAHDMVNLRLGIRHVEHMMPEQIPEALQAVGQMLERVIFEGEFIAKGEAEPTAKIIEPEIASEPFTNKEREQKKRIDGFLINRFWHKGAWTHAINYRLRKATNNPAPNHPRIADKPIMEKEYEYLFGVTDRAKRMMSDFEKDIIRRLVRGEEDLEAVFAEQDAKYKTLLLDIENEVKFLLNSVDRSAIKQFAA